MRTRLAHQQGFGLIQALLGVALLGILSQIALPALHEAVSRRRIETLAAAFLHDLQLARSLAINGERPLRLSVLLAAGGSCYVLHQAPHDRCRCTASGASCEGEEVPLKHRWIAASSRTRIAANVAGITLHPGEGFVTSAGTFRIEQPATGRGIWYVVSPVGRVRSCVRAFDSGRLPPCSAAAA